MEKNISELIKEQIEYYKKRASEYDEWFLRLGRYDKGNLLNKLWFDEVAELRQLVQRFNPRGSVLELACGTGLWTEQLAQYADTIVAIDALLEVIEINRNKSRNYSCPINYEQHDLFTWQPNCKFDVVFFSFWLSHVPPDLLEDFLGRVKLSLKPNGRVFFIDSLPNDSATAHDQKFDHDNYINKRKTNDGKEYNIVKVFYEPKELEQKFFEHGMELDIHKTKHYFIYGKSRLNL